MRELLGFALIGALLSAASAGAVQVCELNGQHVNPANGNTTAGKSGLMRCRDGEGGPVVREETLREGKFVGIVRYYKDGVLEREHSVNERGNRDGLAREFAANKSGENRLLGETTYRDGTTIGIARRWHASGALRRVSFHDDAGREEAVAEFSPDGKLSELRCGTRAQLAPHADDARWCGHSGPPEPVALYGGSGQLTAKVIFERGELRERETLWPNGRPRQRTSVRTEGGTESSFAENGTQRREIQWIHTAADTRPRRVTTLDREFHESGALVRERRWTPSATGADLALEQRWYLNGQPREKLERVTLEGRAAQRETLYHDNGKPSFEGVYVLAPRSARVASGVHRRFDEAGRLRRESHHDARGRVNRERELDETGKVVRDDELFEDGSRKAFSR